MRNVNHTNVDVSDTPELNGINTTVANADFNLKIYDAPYNPDTEANRNLDGNRTSPLPGLYAALVAGPG